MAILAPSILAADFTALGDDIAIIAEAGAGYIHFDVMDGLFVPNLSFGVPVLKSIRPHTAMPLDVHLMIIDPIRLIGAFAEAGADIINFHLEAADDPSACIRKIRDYGKKAAITIKPNTPVEKVLPYVTQVDMVLVMSVEPGFGGQSLIPDALRKVSVLASYIQNNGLCTAIEIDGGVDLSNLRAVLDAGATVIVAGSAVFKKTQAETSNAVKAFLAAMAS